VPPDLGLGLREAVRGLEQLGEIVEASRDIGMIRPIARWSGADEHGGGDCEPCDHVAAGNWLDLLANQKRHRDPARHPNENADPDRARDRARNRPLRDRSSEQPENSV
jgi:hypothetical protein